VLEALTEQQYQFCLIDPEGDYEDLPGAVQFGSAQHGPDVKQVMKAMQDPAQNVVVNLLGIALEDRPVFFGTLFTQLLELRSRTARPHWIVVDEAHHMLPSSWAGVSTNMPQALDGLIFVTVHPEMISPAALEHVRLAVAIGKEPQQTLGGLAKAVGKRSPDVPSQELKTGEGMVWCVSEDQAPFVVRLCEAKGDRRRHLRKYAEGELGPDRSFYFRGPENRLNLRAQNLQMFNAIAEGVDDDTWLFHLREGHYSRWFREAIKDNGLADEVQAVETGRTEDAKASRTMIREAVEKKYTAAT
jgi:hypothetical protein